MAKNEKLESIIIRLIAVAIGCYVALKIARPLTSFVRRVLIPRNWSLECVDTGNCFWLSTTYELLIAYSLAGGVLGICLWLLFKNSAKQLVKFIPLFIFLVYLADQYSFWRAEGGMGYEGNFLSYCVNFLMNSLGLAMLVALPMSAFMAIWYLQKFSSKQGSPSN